MPEQAEQPTEPSILKLPQTQCDVLFNSCMNVLDDYNNLFNTLI